MSHWRSFGDGSNSNGQFWYGNTTKFPGFLYKKNCGSGVRRSTKFNPGGNITTNSPTTLYNSYHAGNSGIGANSIAVRRAKNRIATVCDNNKCGRFYTFLGRYNRYTENPNGYFPFPRARGQPIGIWISPATNYPY